MHLFLDFWVFVFLGFWVLGFLDFLCFTLVFPFCRNSSKIGFGKKGVSIGKCSVCKGCACRRGGPYIYIYTLMYIIVLRNFTYVYIYIYVNGEREREREKKP